MYRCVASGAERDQVLLRIIAGLAPVFPVVDFKVQHGSAGLTSPAIAT
jgi:hypothetical protein